MDASHCRDRDGTIHLTYLNEAEYTLLSSITGPVPLVTFCQVAEGGSDFVRTLDAWLIGHDVPATCLQCIVEEPT